MKISVERVNLEEMNEVPKSLKKKKYFFIRRKRKKSVFLSNHVGIFQHYGKRLKGFNFTFVFHTKKE